MDILDEMNLEIGKQPVVDKEPEVKTEAAAEAKAEEGSEVKTENKETTEEKSSENQSLGDDGKVKESEFANEELAEANAYLKKNPTKSYDDYKALKVPTSELSQDQLIQQYLSEKEGKTATEIALAMKKMEILDESDPEFEEFVDKDSVEYLEAKAMRESLLQNASEWREDDVKEQLTGSKGKPDSDELASPEEFAKAEIDRVKKSREEYLTSTYAALNDIQDIPLNINGETVRYVPSEDFRNEMKTTAEDVGTITQKFFDEAGNIKDSNGFINEVAVWINPKTRAAMHKFMIDQALSQHDANNGRVRRNVNLGNSGGSFNTVPSGVPEGAIDFLEDGSQPDYR